MDTGHEADVTKLLHVVTREQHNHIGLLQYLYQSESSNCVPVNQGDVNDSVAESVVYVATDGWIVGSTFLERNLFWVIIKQTDASWEFLGPIIDQMGN